MRKDLIAMGPPSFPRPDLLVFVAGVMELAGSRASVLSRTALVAITVLPEDVYRPAETWARPAHRLIDFHEVDKGGHFAAWEQRELFAKEFAQRSTHCGSLSERAANRSRCLSDPVPLKN
jgi:pimeloyl-ACP methyl ester carboxylesterase